MNEDHERDAYTWDLASRDLALVTPLTLLQAHEITWALRESRVHPYDALPHLKHLFGDRLAVKAGALAALIEMAADRDGL